MSLRGWYAALTVGAACIFVVVVAVTFVLQLARRLAVQVNDISAALATIRGDTSAIPAIGEINNDSRVLNEVLAGVRQDLGRLAPGGAP